MNLNGLWLTLLAIPIVALYLYKTRLRSELVSTTLFWDQVFQERPHFALRKRLQSVFSLLLALAFLSLLIGAVILPVDRLRNSGTKTIIVFDNSASMNAVDNGTSRFDAAKKNLANLINSRQIQGEIAIITAGGPPKTVLGFTNSSAFVNRAAKNISATNLPKQLEEAVSLAKTISQTNDDETQIFVITDGCTKSISTLLTEKGVTFFPVGRPLDNVAITRLQPRRSFADPLAYEVLIELANWSNMPQNCRLELTLDGTPIDVTPLSLAANSVETQIIRGSSEKGGTLKATVDAVDALLSDNTATVLLPPHKRLKILVHGSGNFFLDNALASLPNIERIFNSELNEENDLVHVYYQTVPQNFPAGNILILDPRNDCELFTVGDLLTSPRIGQTASDSPLLRSVDLNDAIIPGAREIRFAQKDSEPKILAKTPDDSPILFQIEKGDKVTVLTADIERGDFALRTAFPILISNILSDFQNDAVQPIPHFSVDATESDLRMAPAGFYETQTNADFQTATFPPMGLLLTLSALLLTVLDWVLFHRS